MTAWRCPERCPRRECIHVAAERVRRVAAEWAAAEGVIAVARSVDHERLSRALDAYDAAVEYQRASP